jgi:hypothetical protein
MSNMHGKTCANKRATGAQDVRFLPVVIEFTKTSALGREHAYNSFTAVTGVRIPRARQFSHIHTCHAKLPRISRTF